MEEQSFFDRMITHLRSSCKSWAVTGYPFTSEREFVQLLHQGLPVVVAFTIRGNYTKHLDKVLEEAAAEFYPNVKFMRVIFLFPSDNVTGRYSFRFYNFIVVQLFLV
ncbi:reticulon-like protein B12-like [Hibiscus syriacus]|uniref:Reticulon-like protein B12-like n=1 Tax=Hibiscus syriacus TaxID=106335 RepID=A0A6A3AQQ2_HIBSY|nr:reticulon-like protein B12-like [Hibiscus syriacus]